MRHFVFLITVFFHLVSFSQIDILNHSLMRPQEKIAYSNFFNELEIKGMDMNPSVVVISNNALISIQNYSFFYSPHDSIEYDTLKVLNGNNQVGEVVMKIESLNLPKVYLGDLKGTVVKREYLLSNPGLQVTYEPQLFIPHFYVVWCEMSIIKPGKKEMEMIINGNAFSDKQLKQLSKLKAGDVLQFKTVRFSEAIDSEGTDILEINLKLTLVD